MEREILEDCHRLCGVADKTHDYSLQDTIQRRFLEKETRHVKDLGDMIQEVARVAKVPGHGKFLDAVGCLGGANVRGRIIPYR